LLTKSFARRKKFASREEKRNQRRDGLRKRKERDKPGRVGSGRVGSGWLSSPGVSRRDGEGSSGSWGGGGELSILCYSQSGNDPLVDLAKFGYELSMKVIFKKHSIFLATLLE
jgi:hypothetical protein